MTFGDRFCFCRKGGIGRGWWVHLKGTDSMAISGLHLEMPWLALGGPLLSDVAQVNGSPSQCYSKRKS